MRVGIDAEHHTHLDAGRIAAAEGAAAVALHGRTAAQRYSGQADWSEIARLKEHVTDVPVLGNGDIFAAEDAEKMMSETGCDGVVVGRGCLGRPWLFAELSAALNGTEMPVPPNLGEVAAIMMRHGRLLADHHGEDKGMREMRKHIAWYMRGFPAGSELRNGMARVSSLAELEGSSASSIRRCRSPRTPRARVVDRARPAPSPSPTAGSTTRRTRSSRPAPTSCIPADSPGRG